MKTNLAIAAISVFALASGARAASVADWVLIFDGNSDAAVTNAGTASPGVTNADKVSIAASFPTITLADGDSLTFTGTVSFSQSLPNNQFRFGLFHNAAAPSPGVGSGYVGYYAEATANGAAKVASSDGTSTTPSHPFGSAESTPIGTMSNNGVIPAADTPLDFSLVLTRNGTTVDLVASVTDGGTYFSSETVTGTAAFPADYTYNSAAFLMGSGFETTASATYSNMDVTYVPEPSSALLGLLGLGLIRRRRA